MPNVDAILSRLHKVHKRGPNKWQACCPAHEDASPSLAIAEADGKILLHCFGGCGVADILGAIGADWSDIFEPDKVGKLSGKEWHALDVLRSVRAEITAAWMLCLKLQHSALDQADRERLATCIARLDAADEFARSSRQSYVERPVLRKRRAGG